MAVRTGSTNPKLRRLIFELKKLGKEKNIKLWLRIAYELERSTRKRREVNVYKIDKDCRENEIAIVPGKVLSLGELNKKITVSAWNFSNIAKEKINKNGKAISIEELMKINPQGKNVRIIG